MTPEQKIQVEGLWVDGMGYKKIASITGLSRSTIRSHLKRHSLFAPSPVAEPKPIKPPTGIPVILCRQCGQFIPQCPKRKRKSFCSDKCRVTWFNHHRSSNKEKP